MNRFAVRPKIRPEPNPRHHRNRWLPVLAALFALTARGGDYLLDSCEEATHWKTLGRATVRADAGTIRITGSGEVETHYRIPFEIRNGFGRMQGLSFRIKLAKAAPVQLPVTVNSQADWEWRYSCRVPLRGDGWQQVTLAWSDFLPVRNTALAGLGSSPLEPWIGLDRVIFGGDRITAKEPETFSYQIDDLKFVEQAPGMFPPVREQGFTPLATVRQKLRRGGKVLIFCAGDANTAGRGRIGEGNSGARLEAKLRRLYPQTGIEVRTIARGNPYDSDTLRGFAREDFAGSTPDLLIIHTGMEEKNFAVPAPVFKSMLDDYLRRVSSLTGGRCAVLLVPTLPGIGARFEMMDDYAAAVRQLAAKRKLSLCDPATVFKAMGEKKLRDFYQGNWYLNDRGHEAIGAALADAIAGGDR